MNEKKYEYTDKACTKTNILLDSVCKSEGGFHDPVAIMQAATKKIICLVLVTLVLASSAITALAAAANTGVTAAGIAGAAGIKRIIEAARAAMAVSADPVSRSASDGGADMPRAETVSVSSASSTGRKIPILMYHAIEETPTTTLTNLFVRPSEMEAHLLYLAENGYQCITFEDLDNIGAFSKPVMLTFDDGYKDNYTNLFPLLKKYNMKATIFVITDTFWSDNFLSQEEIREMSDSGLISIQSHTASHPSLTSLGKEALDRELSKSKEIIEELTGKPVIALCYPAGNTNKAVMDATARHYAYAVLAKGGKYSCGTDIMAMNRIRIDRGVGVNAFASLLG